MNKKPNLDDFDLEDTKDIGNRINTSLVGLSASCFLYVYGYMSIGLNAIEESKIHKDPEENVVSLDPDSSLKSAFCDELNSDTPVIEVGGQLYTVNCEP